LRTLIERNGGRITDQHECFTYQIKPDAKKYTFEHFYKGPLYHEHWIGHSVAEGKVLNKEDYFICINVEERSRRLNIAKKKKYTIIEGIKLYETMNNIKT
jgi:hypothetical protein